MKEDTALVSGFARSFISGAAIPNATITVLENEALRFQTDRAGKFGPFSWPVGQPLTLVFEKPGAFWTGYKTTQTATLIVPPNGFNDKNYLKNISFQVPSNFAFKFLSFAIGIKEKPNTCQIAATVIPSDTTMDDIPQGIKQVKVSLSPDINSKPFYFGMFPFFHKTNPFVRSLKSTSLDGGVAFLNVPPGDYVMRASKKDMTFSEIKIKAREGVVVNASPPHGPTCNELKQQVANHFGFFKPIVMGIAAGLAVAGMSIGGLFE